MIACANIIAGETTTTQTPDSVDLSGLLNGNFIFAMLLLLVVVSALIVAALVVVAVQRCRQSSLTQNYSKDMAALQEHLQETRPVYVSRHNGSVEHTPSVVSMSYA